MTKPKLLQPPSGKRLTLPIFWSDGADHYPEATSVGHIEMLHSRNLLIVNFTFLPKYAFPLFWRIRGLCTWRLEIEVLEQLCLQNALRIPLRITFRQVVKDVWGLLSRYSWCDLQCLFWKSSALFNSALKSWSKLFSINEGVSLYIHSKRLSGLEHALEIYW